MENIENRNTCAFPADSKSQTDGGLTKREYAAIMAMQGILSAADLTTRDGVYTVNGLHIDIPLVSREAVAMADALFDKLHSTFKN
jgi:hypothetical protein